jgi:hypothetical protein
MEEKFLKGNKDVEQTKARALMAKIIYIITEFLLHKPCTTCLVSRISYMLRFQLKLIISQAKHFPLNNIFYYFYSVVYPNILTKAWPMN